MIGYKYCFGMITFYDDETQQEIKEFALTDIQGINDYVNTLPKDNKEFLKGAAQRMNLEWANFEKELHSE